MNRLLILPVLLLTLLVGTPAFSADWEKGLTAYKSGDYATALREWTPLAKQGNAIAQTNLGRMYGLGTGVIQDNVYAHMWLNIAASSGDKDAVKNRYIVAGWMTPSQLETAEKLARECVRKKYKGC
jgi:TPR repeat protein